MGDGMKVVSNARWIAGTAGAALLLLCAPRAVGQQAVVPSFDRRVEAPSSELEEAAWFGYTMEFGNLDDLTLDTMDDLLVTAFQKNVSQLPDVGTAYAYSGGASSLAGHPFHSVILPADIDRNEQFGLRKVHDRLPRDAVRRLFA